MYYTVEFLENNEENAVYHFVSMEVIEKGGEVIGFIRKFELPLIRLDRPIRFE
jgi:hypothetical protein